MLIKDKFNLHAQWLEYLRLIGISEDILSPIQKQEMKRSFFAACGQMLILFRDGIGAIESEEKAVKQMENLLNQVSDFWENEEKNGLR